MLNRRLWLIVSLVCLGFVRPDSVLGAALYDPEILGIRDWQKPSEGVVPNWGIELHKINNLWLAVSNGGSFGTGMANSYLDPETGLPAPSCEYPAGSNISYLYLGAFWAGAVVGRDTLVSVGFDGNYYVREFWPDPGPGGGFIRRSNMPTSMEYSIDAVSEQDFICSFTDTFTDLSLTGNTPSDNRLHIPLGLRVDQRTYSWSYDYAADFILFDYTIKNIGRFPLKQTYFGIYVDADVFHESNNTGWIDDIIGYVNDIPSPEAPGYRDTVRIAWAADNDGDPNPSGNFDFSSATGLTGTAVLRTPNPDLKYSFNWWVASGTPANDWGPRMAGTEERPFRDFGTGMGSPNGDRNKYYMMSSNEFDYDQLESAISHAAEGWLGPPPNAQLLAKGFDARYLLSFGPFDLQPGDTLPITMAYVAGSDFHRSGRDYELYWDPTHPDEYQRLLDVTNLGKNAKWAKWVFDNPGYDTDGDGDSGKVRWIIDPNSNDSTAFWYEGDGVPDFRGAAPPPPPVVRVIPDYGRLVVQWNGWISENSLDIFSGINDFEGYRIYYGQDNRLTDYVQLAAYDRDNYNLYSFNANLRRWEISDIPLPRDSITALFGPEIDPEMYPTPQRCIFKNGVAYYFVAQGWNADDLRNPAGIHRIYPDADPADPGDTTEEGYPRYYEYEYIIDNIEPSRPYYVSVTAFDFGSRRILISSLESSPNVNAVLAYALPNTEMVEAQGLNVQVFPNPYRIDGGYARAGYENRDRTKSAERARSINFINLPRICTIRIFSIDGDLIKQIEHFQPDGGPTAQFERWNVISRNTQAVVTGIYIYQISSEMGEQLGKLVIIK